MNVALTNVPKELEIKDNVDFYVFAEKLMDYMQDIDFREEDNVNVSQIMIDKVKKSKEKEIFSFINI
ncbi:hypothetical protein HOG21_00085 [bacterium]|jgi:hypothetical protein|nr:hypothetical protein [bacterium]